MFNLQAGIVEADANSVIERPRVYLKAAKKACRANVDNIKSLFPLIYDSDVPFLCMDLVYEYTLLVEAFGTHHIYIYRYNLNCLKSQNRLNSILLIILMSWKLNVAGIKPTKEITVVKNLEYKGSLIGAAWPLGCGIDVLSAAQLPFHSFNN